MTTVDEITINADPDLIFRIAENIVEWPRILPHYRRVKILGQTSGGRVAEMAAHHGVIPMRWTVVQTLDIRKRHIGYRHIEGATQGLEVIWRIEPGSEGVRVSITRDLRLKHPLAPTAIGQFIVAQLFIKLIDTWTLQQFKHYLEHEIAPCEEQPLTEAAA